MSSVFLATMHGKWMPTRFGIERQKVLNELRADGIYGGDTWAIGLRVDTNYNNCVVDFLNSGATHLLMLNDDMGYPEHVGQRLLEADKSIIGGLYFNRDGEWKGLPQFYERRSVSTDRWGRPAFQYRPLVKEVYSALSQGGVIKIDGTGTGCLLVEREVFEVMAPPWFESEGSLAGDLNFFRMAQGLDLSIYGHCGVQCEHYTDESVNMETFLRLARGEGLGFPIQETA